MILRLRLVYYKFQLGRWLVRKAYARDTVLREACKQVVGYYRRKILLLSPLPTSLSVAERRLRVAEAQRQNRVALLQRVKPRRTRSDAPLWARFMAFLGGARCG